MAELTIEKEIANLIILCAKERMETEKVQNLNSAIHAVKLDVTQFLMEEMTKTNKK